MAEQTVIDARRSIVLPREILAELPALAQEVASGTLDVDARPTPLADVEHAWADAARTAQRIVLTPQPWTGTERT